MGKGMGGEVHKRCLYFNDTLSWLYLLLKFVQSFCFNKHTYLYLEPSDFLLSNQVTLWGKWSTWEIQFSNTLFCFSKGIVFNYRSSWDFFFCLFSYTFNLVVYPGSILLLDPLLSPLYFSRHCRKQCQDKEKETKYKFKPAKF